MKAINEKVTQEQLRLGAENKLKTVESEQKQKVAVAEAEARAVKGRGRRRGLCQSHPRHGAGEGPADPERGAGEEQGRAGAAPHRGRKIKAEKWNGALPSAIYAGAPIPFLNVSK